jgi:GAF domain-containing protein
MIRAVGYQDIVEQLLQDTGASRTTLRLDSPEAFFAVVAEACAPGIGSIAGDTSIDLAASATFKSLDREQRLLVQPDLLAADPAPPPELIEFYGARAQMLAPIVRNGSLVGIVSVHYAPGPREWTPEEVTALERAVERVQAELG